MWRHISLPNLKKKTVGLNGVDGDRFHLFYFTFIFVCMVFAPCNKSRIVSDIFPNFVLCGQPLQFVSEFRYLGHIISNQHKDDTDIAREIRCMYTRVNMLIRKFHKCSTEVKIRLFRAYCICLYGAALWTHFAAESVNKFKRCYHKCIKMFLGTANITVSLLFCLIWNSPVLTLLCTIPVMYTVHTGGRLAICW